MKTANKTIGRLIVGCSFAYCLTSILHAQITPGNGNTGGGTNTYSPLPDIPNYLKYQAQSFQVLDTNSVATTDTNLFNALASFSTDNGTNPVLQVMPYQGNCLLFKASHFDYTTETTRDFALIINDKANVPIYKTVDLTGTTTNKNGWLIQGVIHRTAVTDPMYLLVSNISRSYSAYFKVVPYDGPTVQFTGANDGDTVSGDLPLTVTVTDLSGVTNQQIAVLLDGLPARYSITASNAVKVETKYYQNGTTTFSVKAANDNAYVLCPTNNTDTKTSYENVATLSLDFENPFFVVNSGDMASPDIGSVYLTFGTTQSVSVVASITEPVSGRLLAQYSGTMPSAGAFALQWDFTEANGSPCTNTQYAVSIAATSIAGNNFVLMLTNLIDPSGVRTAGGCILNNEGNSTWGNGTYFNQQEDIWGQTLENVYESLYDKHWDSMTLYTTGDIGPSRENPQNSAMPFTVTSANQGSWEDWLKNTLANRNFSDYNWGPGHANGYFIGGGPWIFNWMNYVTTAISAQDFHRFALSVGGNWRLRKIAMWGCYTARGKLRNGGMYDGWSEAAGIRPTPKQMTSFMWKNAGLFFNEELFSNPYGDPATTVYEVAEAFDYFWIAGQDPYPGGCNPNYSIQRALMMTEEVFPELANSEPVIIGYPYLPYNGNNDFSLLMLDSSSVIK